MDNDDSEDTARLWREIVNSRRIVMESQEIARLINAGADPNLTNNNTKQTYIQWVCGREFILAPAQMMQTLEIFLNHPKFDVNHIDGYGSALIHQCVQMRDPRYLEYLLVRRRGDINIDVQIGTSYWFGNDGLMQERVTSITGCTALNFLFGQITHRQGKLQLLLDNGANPNIVDHSGFGPIHKLIRNANHCKQTEIIDNIRRLLMPNHNNNNNADPNLRVQGGDFVGFTPLHVALATRCQEYVFDALLLKGGADVGLRNNAGRNALEYARLLSSPPIDPAILDLLWKNSPEFRAMRLHAERVLWRPTHGNSEIYQRILEEGGLHPPRPPPQ